MSSGGIKTDIIDLVRVYLYIARNPGKGPTAVGEGLGLTRTMVLCRLKAMERVGLLVSEDKKARLWPFSCGGYLDH